MQTYYWEAILKNGDRLREGIHNFRMATQENLVRLMLIGQQDTVCFDMEDGVIKLNLCPIEIELGDQNVCGRPDEFFTFKHAEFYAGPGGVGNRLTKYDIGYVRKTPAGLVRVAYIIPIGEPGYLQLTLTPQADMFNNLKVHYRGTEFVMPTELKGGHEWQIELNIR